jgi:hypothetical protein
LEKGKNVMPPGDVDAIRLKEIEKRDKYWEGISERTRALCLGTLVLIWGIFSQKKGDATIFFSPRAKLFLLAIAGISVLVLGFDFLEYLASFQHHRRASGEVIRFESFPYERGEKIMRIAKIVLGIIALVGVCGIIGYALMGTVNAATLQNNHELFGTWCGGDKRKGEYVCVQISRPYQQLEMKLGFQGRDGWLSCHRLRFEGDETLSGVCGLAAVKNVHKNESMVTQIILDEHTYIRTLFRTGD